MEYAKLENGKLTKCVIFPNGMSVLNGRFKRNTTEADILAAGYLPIEEQDEPESRDGYLKSSRWVQTDSAIVKKWTQLPDRRPLSQSDVTKMLLANQINSLAVDDNTAVRMKQFYPSFDKLIGQKVTKGFRFLYGNTLYSVEQPELTFQAHYPPGVGMESLYAEVCESHAGTLDDPVPYNGNMALENGKYYSQKSVIYLCNRDTVNPVYAALAELVGQYVKEV